MRTAVPSQPVAASPGPGTLTEPDAAATAAKKRKGPAPARRRESKASKAAEKLERKETKTKRDKKKTAYDVFYREHFALMRQRNPEAKFGELAKLVAAEWKALPVDRRAVFDKAASDLNAAHAAPHA
jgi:hypothetical protein